MFEIEFKPRALKALSKTDRKMQLAISSAIDTLKQGKFDLLDMRGLRGKKYGHRVRVGRWRILFDLFFKQKCIKVVDIFLKKGKDDYKKRMHLLE